MSNQIYAAERLAAVRLGLEAIGYTRRLVQEGYRFADYSGAGIDGAVRSIDLAVFGQEPLSTKTACLGVVVGKRTEEELVAYRALGAPQLITLSPNSVDRWKVLAEGPPKWLSSIPINRITEVISANGDEWGPQPILRAKAISFGPPDVQLDFFDAGLVPTIERVVRKKLSDLLNRAVAEVMKAYSARHIGELDFQGLLRMIFRLLAAKLLADRRHEGQDWLSGTPADVVRRVERFYFPDRISPVPKALDDPIAQLVAWEHISRSFHLENVSLDTLAWIWEHTFVTKEIRRSLGIYGTPPEVAEYVVRRLPFETMPLEQLRVLELFAGHAVFLVAALGRIRELLLAEQPGLNASERHECFVRMLTGMEVDSFAIEVARLSLMLADYPHPVGWKLLAGDVFRDSRMAELLKSGTAILCNPPFGTLVPEELSLHADRGTYNRAVSILTQVLANPPALLGFVLPRVFRNGKAFREARRQIAQSYETVEVTELPDSLFAHADVESVLVIAYGRGLGTTKLLAKTVRRGDLERFFSTGEPSSVRVATITPDEAEVALWRYELEQIWSALKDHPRLSSIATPHRGIEYKLKLRKYRDELISTEPRTGLHAGVDRMSDDFQPFFLSRHVYLNMDDRLIRRKAHLRPWGMPKVLVNRHRKSRGAWTLIAIPDYSGLVGYENFHGIWATGNVPPEVIAAILNGYVANAFVSVMEEKRNSGGAAISEIPIPVLSETTIRQLTDLVSLYRVERAELQINPSPRRSARCVELLEQIDIIVLKAYDLSPALERELLVYFTDESRPGMDVLRRDYGPLAGATIPLPLDETDFEAAPPPSGSIEQADAAFAVGLLRLAATVRSTHPELFDESGELRMEDALRLLARRTNGKKVLSRAELLALTGQGDGLPPDAT